MAIKQTAFRPLPHKHDAKDINGIEEILYGQPGRTRPPMCEFVLNSQQSIYHAQDTPNTLGYGVVNQSEKMFYTYNEQGPGDTGYQRVIIPLTGRYELVWHPILDGVGSAPTACHILLNSVNVGNGSIASDTKVGGGWCAPRATVTRQLSAGDRLYFFTWQGSGNHAFMRTHMFGNARTRGLVRWVGRE